MVFLLEQTQIPDIFYTNNEEICVHRARRFILVSIYNGAKKGRISTHYYKETSPWARHYKAAPCFLIRKNLN